MSGDRNFGTGRGWPWTRTAGIHARGLYGRGKKFMAAGLVETDEGVYVAALAAARLGALSVAVEGRRRRRRIRYYYHYYFIPKSWSLERRSWRRGADCIQCVMCVCVCVCRTGSSLLLPRGDPADSVSYSAENNSACRVSLTRLEVWKILAGLMHTTTLKREVISEV